MATVIPRRQSVQYDGTNGPSIDALLGAGSGYWQLVHDTGTEIQWTGSDMEPDWLTVPAGGWLILSDSGNGYLENQGGALTPAEYEARYAEVNTAALDT